MNLLVKPVLDELRADIDRGQFDGEGITRENRAGLLRRIDDAGLRL